MSNLPLCRIPLKPLSLHLVKAAYRVLVENLSIDDDRAFDAEHAYKENFKRLYIRRYIFKAEKRFMWVEVGHLCASSKLNAVDFQRG